MDMDPNGLKNAPPPPLPFSPGPMLEAGMERGPTVPPPSHVFGHFSDPHSYTSGQFTTGLFDCCEGPQACEICCAGILSCWAHGIIGDVTGGGVGRAPPCALTGCLWLTNNLGSLMNALKVCVPFNIIYQVPVTIAFVTLGILGRKKMREKYGIRGECCPGDFCTMFWCQPCAFAQEIRHIRDATPDRHLGLWSMTSPTRDDLSFLQRAAAAFC